MRVLFLAHRIPFPPDKGDKIRSYHELEHMASRHEVTLATLIDDAADRPHVERLRSMVRELLVEELPRRRARPRALLGLVSGRPLSLEHFRDRRLERAVASRIDAGRFDVALVFSSSMVPYVGLPPRLPAVLDLVDLDSRKWSQVAERARAPLRALFRLEARRLGRFEARCGRHFSRTIVCTNAEAEEARELLDDSAAAERIEVVLNGIDGEAFPFEEPRAREPGVVFTGAMDYIANADAVRYFLDEIWGTVKLEVPEATFTIVGRNPGRDVRALASSPGVRVTGAVPDVRPYLKRASVAVAPMRIAQGIQNKIIEALASGIPVVATPKAARGIENDVLRAIAVEEAPSRFAGAVIDFLRDPERRVNVARLARQLVVSRYNWPLSMSRLEQILKETADPPASSLHRAASTPGTRPDAAGRHHDG